MGLLYVSQRIDLLQLTSDITNGGRDGLFPARVVEEKWKSCGREMKELWKRGGRDVEERSKRWKRWKRDGRGGRGGRGGREVEELWKRGGREVEEVEERSMRGLLTTLAGWTCRGTRYCNCKGSNK